MTNNNNNNNNNNMDNYLICSDATLSAINNNTNEWIQFSDEQLQSLAYGSCVSAKDSTAPCFEDFSSDLSLIKVSLSIVKHFCSHNVLYFSVFSSLYFFFEFPTNYSF
jgi:hypothetical protein